MGKSLFGFFEEPKSNEQIKSEAAHGEGVKDGKRGEGHVEMFFESTLPLPPDFLISSEHKARMAGLNEGHSQRAWGGSPEAKSESSSGVSSSSGGSYDTSDSSTQCVNSRVSPAEGSRVSFFIFGTIAAVLLYFSFSELYDWLTFEGGPAAYEIQDHTFSVFFAFVGSFFGLCFAAASFAELSKKAGTSAWYSVLSVFLCAPLGLLIFIHLTNPQHGSWPPSPIWVLSAFVGGGFFIGALAHFLES